MVPSSGLFRRLLQLYTCTDTRLYLLRVTPWRLTHDPSHGIDLTLPMHAQGITMAALETGTFTLMIPMSSHTTKSSSPQRNSPTWFMQLTLRHHSNLHPHITPHNLDPLSSPTLLIHLSHPLKNWLKHFSMPSPLLLLTPSPRYQLLLDSQ